MRIPEHIDKQLRKRGGRYSADHSHMNVRIKLDNHIALKQICTENRYLIGNVIDYLIEGFIASYREMWPVDGMYQTQLTRDEFVSQVTVQPDNDFQALKKRRAIPQYVTDARNAFFNMRPVIRAGKDDGTETEKVLIRCLGEAIENDDPNTTNIESWLKEIQELMKR